MAGAAAVAKAHNANLQKDDDNYDDNAGGKNANPLKQHRPAQSVGRTPLERSEKKELLQGGKCGEQLSFRKRMMLFSLTMTHMMMMMMMIMMMMRRRAMSR